MVEEIIKVMETNGQLQGKYLQILFTDRLRHLHLKGTIITNQIVKLLAQKARVRLVSGNGIIYKSPLSAFPFYLA